MVNNSVVKLTKFSQVFKRPRLCMLTVQDSKATICCVFIVSHRFPACFFGTRFVGHYCTISRSICVHAADLHVGLLLSVLLNEL